MFARTHRRRRFVASSEILTSGLVALLRMTEEGANNRVVEGANPYGECANSARWARKCVGAIHELPGNCQTPKRAIRESPLLINYKQRTTVPNLIKRAPRNSARWAVDLEAEGVVSTREAYSICRVSRAVTAEGTSTCSA